ncbi:MAG: hypothetical protein U0H60_08925 [Lachnospiraceae bacterium]|nr:hypothetical protein [Lachnospiraceae bacterium]
MKRCIICGNLGDDNSTVCEVCGNPYMDLDDDAPDRMEAGDDPVTEPDISEDWEPEQEAPVAEEVEAQDEISEAEEIEEEPEQQAIAPKEEPEQQTMAPEEEPEQQAMVPEEEPEQGAVPALKAKQTVQTARPRTAGNNGHRMKSGPQIYGQMAGQGAPDQMQQDGMLRRTMNGNDRPANHHPTAGVRRPIAGQSRPMNSQGQPMQGRPMNGQGQPMQGRPMNGQGQPMQGRPMNSQGQPSQGRPMNSQGQPMQGRPMNSQGQPMQGRPMNSQGQPMQGRPMNSQGQPMMQNRPMSAPQYDMPSMGFRNTKIQEMSKKSFQSPIFLLVALLQTVYLAGSIAAIFMKQLNFSQVMRLITGISMPTQITGYMDQLLKLMAKLDTGAVLANLAIRIPDILMCLGLWMIVFAARSKKTEMPGVGFTFLKIVVIIGLIKSCVLMLAGLVISVALVVSAWVSGVQTMIVAAVVTLVIMIVLTMLVVMYYFSYLAMLRTFRTNTQKGESYGAASGYVAVVYILMGLFGIIGLLSGIVNGEISGIVGSAGRIGWMLLMAFWIFGYRSTLGEIED